MFVWMMIVSVLDGDTFRKACKRRERSYRPHAYSLRSRELVDGAAVRSSGECSIKFDNDYVYNDHGDDF